MTKVHPASQMMNVSQNNKGLTLIEVLIAMVVFLLVSLAMMQTALVGIDSNMINVLREEAVKIAEEAMIEARNEPFDSLVEGTTTLPTVSRNLRNTMRPFTVARAVTDHGDNNKEINILVTWEWKDQTVAHGNPYTHSITTILRRP
jgi:prepilin-type N-terminal cleavage/methylation domain-containing protein